MPTLAARRSEHELLPDSGSKRSWRLIVVGVGVAIGVTAAMDATGLTAFSALPLCPIALALWYADRIPRESVGLVWGRARTYVVALLFPVLFMATLLTIAAAAGAADFAAVNWKKAWLNVALVGGSTVLVALLTEEGFFRGWLWAALERTGMRARGLILVSSLCFAAWHVSAVVLPTGFDVPGTQAPIFIANAFVIGVALALIRVMSGSIVASSVTHGVWNGLAYVFFGFGVKVGALGVHPTRIFGPEVGIVGLALNAVLTAALWHRWHVSASSRAAEA